MDDVVLVSGARTPVGRFGSAFVETSAAELESIARFKKLLYETGLPL